MLEREHNNLDHGDQKCLEDYMRETAGQPVRKTCFV